MGKLNIAHPYSFEKKILFERRKFSTQETEVKISTSSGNALYKWANFMFSSLALKCHIRRPY